MKDKYRWFIDGERMGIVEEKTSGEIDTSEKYLSPQVAGDTLTVHYTSKASHFSTDLTTSSEIPSQFHEALAFKVIGELYKLPGQSFNLQLASYYDQQYELLLREGKKYAKSNHQSGGVIKPHDF